MSRADGQILARALLEGTVTIALIAGVVDMWGCGNGSKGQLGMSQNDSFTSFGVPRLAVQEKGIRTVACGAEHTIVLLDNGTLFAFGNGEDGQLGNGSQSSASAPVFLKELAEQTL